MSRCFPFPPPGYERKLKPEDLDLLKEAKRKEKKHKKEKKDKERKKDKEKEKDGDEKHREKKDRKEKHKDKKDKHKDKKKDKEDRGKEKEKSSISEESTVAGKVEEQLQFVGGKHQSRGHGKDSSPALFQSRNGEKPPSSQGIEDSKILQELDRRIRDEKKGNGSQLPALVEKKDQEMAAGAAVRNSFVLRAEEKEENRGKKIDRKMDLQGLGNDNIGGTSVSMSQSIVERTSRPVDGQNGRSLVDKETHKEMFGISQGHKQKDKESHGKEKEKKEKEKRKQDGAKLKSEEKKSEPGKLKEVRNNLDGGVVRNAGQGPVLSKDHNSDAVKEANIRKRKDGGTNGFLHDTEMRPNKMQKPAPPHQPVENGRKPEVFQTPSRTPHDKHVIHNSVRSDKRDQLPNGIVESQRPSPSPSPSPYKTKSSLPTTISNQTIEPPKPHPDSKSLKKATKVPELEDQIAEASRRPPHPDSKYLHEVLTIPKMENLPEVDDQDWLFSKRSPSNKPKAEPSGVGEDPQPIWSEAVHIESVDIWALPYVIPY